MNKLSIFLLQLQNIFCFSVFLFKLLYIPASRSLKAGGAGCMESRRGWAHSLWSADVWGIPSWRESRPQRRGSRFWGSKEKRRRRRGGGESHRTVRPRRERGRRITMRREKMGWVQTPKQKKTWQIQEKSCLFNFLFIFYLFFANSAYLLNTVFT